MVYAPLGKKGRIWPSFEEYQAELDYFVEQTRALGLSTKAISRRWNQYAQTPAGKLPPKDIKFRLGKPRWTRTYPDKTAEPLMPPRRNGTRRARREIRRV